MHVGSSASDDYQIETLSGMVHGVLAFGSVREDPAKVLSPDGFQSLSVKHLDQQCHGYLMTQSVCHVKSHWMLVIFRIMHVRRRGTLYIMGLWLRSITVVGTNAQFIPEGHSDA